MSTRGDEYLDQETFKSIISSLKRQTETQLAEMRTTSPTADSGDDLDDELSRMYSRHGKKKLARATSNKKKPSSAASKRPQSGSALSARSNSSKQSSMPNFYPMSRRPTDDVSTNENGDDLLFRSALHNFVIGDGVDSDSDVDNDTFRLSPSPQQKRESRPQTARIGPSRGLDLSARMQLVEQLQYEQRRDVYSPVLQQHHTARDNTGNNANGAGGKFKSPYEEDLVKRFEQLHARPRLLSNAPTSTALRTDGIFAPRQPVRPMTARSPRSVLAMLPRSSSVAGNQGQMLYATQNGGLVAAAPPTQDAKPEHASASNNSKPVAKKSNASGAQKGRPKSAPSTASADALSKRRLQESTASQKRKEETMRREAMNEDRATIDTVQVQIQEANDILRSMGKQRAFAFFRASRDSDMRVHVYEDDRMVKDLSLEMFQREYRVLRAHAQTAAAAQAAKTSEMAAMQGTGSGMLRAGPHVMRKETKERLRNILLDTIQLTTKLKEQVEEMDRRGAPVM